MSSEKEKRDSAQANEPVPDSPELKKRPSPQIQPVTESVSPPYNDTPDLEYVRPPPQYVPPSAPYPTTTGYHVDPVYPTAPGYHVNPVYPPNYQGYPPPIDLPPPIPGT